MRFSKGSCWYPLQPLHMEETMMRGWAVGWWGRGAERKKHHSMSGTWNLYAGFGLLATAWQQRRPYAVIEYSKFCVEGTLCSVIHH